jgi:hypothetical protein
MGTQSLTHTRRQLGRARITANAALAAPEGRQVALKVVAPDMLRPVRLVWQSADSCQLSAFSPRESPQVAHHERKPM